jgi:hypothetical protein
MIIHYIAVDYQTLKFLIDFKLHKNISQITVIHSQIQKIIYSIVSYHT